MLLWKNESKMVINNSLSLAEAATHYGDIMYVYKLGDWTGRLANVILLEVS